MSKYSDEQLMAYADGGLDAALRAQIESELRHDPDMARRVEAFGSMRTRLVEEFAPELEEPVPTRFRALLAPPDAEVIELDARRSRASAERRRFARSAWLAVAASLLLGIAAGWLIRSPGGALPLRAVGGEMLAAGSLDAALQQELASQPGAGPVRVGLTFRDQRGRVCRTFSDSGRPGISGLACHVAQGWRLEVLARDADAAGQVREAGSMPAIIAHAVETRISGQPLDAQAERAARDADWR